MTQPMQKLPWHRPVILDITAEYYRAPNPIAKLPWHRPVIRDVTHEYPEYRRPNAEQSAAGHRDVERRWERHRAHRGEETPDKPEDVRLAHLRWSELQRLMRHRYGVVLPDTAEARRDLEILFNYAILTGKKVQHQAELLAPWLSEGEIDHMAAQRPVLHKADDLAHKLGLQYCDRQALAITTIGSVDVDQAERDRLRRQRDSERKRQKRAATAKQQQEKAVQTHTANLPPKAQKVLARIGRAEIAVPELIRRVASLKEFRKLAEPRRQLHKIVDHLVAVGLVADRNENQPQGGKVRFVWRQQ